jgi:hypothetical protein
MMTSHGSVPTPESVRCESTDLMILSDGTLYIRNLTPALAMVLLALNPADEPMRRRAGLSPGASVGSWSDDGYGFPK